MRKLLTQSDLDHIPLCPEGKRREEVCDTDLPGLYLEKRETLRNPRNLEARSLEGGSVAVPQTNSVKIL